MKFKKYLLWILGGITLTILFYLILLKTNKEPTLLAEVLELAGDNKSELTNTISYYSHSDDPLKEEKIEAAKHLITGMPGMINYDSNYLAKFQSVLSQSHKIATDLEATGLPWWTQLRFQYYDSMSRIVREWQKSTGIIGPGSQQMDLDVITSTYLLRNIDLAFYTRSNYPWTKKLFDHDFLEFVLPYAFGTGPLDNWRAYLYQRYSGYIEHAGSNPDSLKQAVNRILYSMGHMHFTTSLSPYIDFMSVDQILYAKGSTCSAKAKVNIQVLRALGIPITTDFYQFPANQSAVFHEWNVIVNGDSTWSFDPYWQDLNEPWINGAGEKSIHNDKYRTMETLRISKVFRSMYSIQEDLLELVTKTNGDVPPFFRNLKMRDVSSTYLNVSDVDVYTDTEMEFIYVNNFTFNHEWKPVFWTKDKDKGVFQFKNLGRDIAYMATSYKNGNQTSLSEPFILHDDGTIQWTTSKGDTTTLVLDQLRFDHDEDDRRKNAKLTEFKDKHFTLFRWTKEGWILLGERELTGESLVYHGVPGQGMYLLVNPDGGGRERIFTYDHGKQNWW